MAYNFISPACVIRYIVVNMDAVWQATLALQYIMYKKNDAKWIDRNDCPPCMYVLIPGWSANMKWKDEISNH